MNEVLFDDNLIKQAISLHDNGQLREAEELCHAILSATPNCPQILNLLGIICFQLGRPEDGFVLLRQAVDIQPDFSSALYNLGNAYRLQGDLAESEKWYRQSIAAAPESIKSINNLANILRAQSRLVEAEDLFNKAIVLAPDFAEVYNNLGLTLTEQGKVFEAEAQYKKALSIRSNYFKAYSNLLLNYQYTPDISDQQIFAEHKKWDLYCRQFISSNAKIFSGKPRPDKKLRIGYVSADLARHPMGYFMSDVFSLHDSNKFELFCYSDRATGDDLSFYLKKSVTTWRNTCNLSDEALADLIYRDHIDILVDLSGHTSGNRMVVFVMKPAPVQVSWAGYVGTTGLSTMDYLISDWIESPVGAEKYCVENIIRLPDSYVCYAPPNYAPPVTSLPADKNGFVTFGCFNNISKINDQVIVLWSKILKSIPDSRLILKTLALSDNRVAERYKEMLEELGIERERIICHGKSPHRELLEWYGRLDIALDPFPYSGGVTTLESLWMGVPVITLGGSRFCSRHTISHLSTVGLYGTIASSFDDYIRIAVEMSLNLDKLSAIRGGLRDLMRGSPICDGKKFTKNLETAYRTMWSEYCEKRHVK